MMQPDRMGFFGGHVEGAAGGHGIFVRDDGQRFPWQGIDPFYTFQNGETWPAFCNRTRIPGAPHNVPGARAEVWSYGPFACLYAGKYPFSSNALVGWLFPIAPGEVLWIGAPGAAGMADQGDFSARPAFKLSVSGDVPVSPKWVCSSLDGSCAVIYDGNSYYDAHVSVVKNTGVNNQNTTSKIRYDVSIVYAKHQGSIGRVIDIENNSIADVDFQNLSTDEDMGFASINGNSVQLIKQITHYKYSYAGKVLLEYRHDFVYGVPNDYVKELAIEQYLLDHGMADRLVTVNVCGQVDVDSKSFPRTSMVGYRFSIYPCNMFYGTVVELADGSSLPVVRHSFFGDAFNAVKTPQNKVIKKNSNALIIRAISPEKVYLSDSETDQSFFFV